MYFLGVHKHGVSCVNVNIRIAYMDSYRVPVERKCTLYRLTTSVDACGVGGG